MFKPEKGNKVVAPHETEQNRDLLDDIVVKFDIT